MVSRSHQGLVRLNNEDCVHCDTAGKFVVLADGMGGLLAGEVASAVAIDAACKGLRDPALARTSSADLESVLSRANTAVTARAKAMRYVGKMGTTMVAWALGEERAYYGYVGDSRLYTYSDQILTQQTRDHTLAQRMLDDGQIAEEDESYMSNSHVLTHAMGIPGLFHADCGELPACQRVLLCSDGLSDLVEADEICAIMATPDLEDCANFLLKAALDRGGRDNVTVALVEF